MLSKAVSEIAKTFMKDGMMLDDAVLAAYRLMDEQIPAAVPKILNRTTKAVDALPVGWREPMQPLLTDISRLPKLATAAKENAEALQKYITTSRILPNPLDRRGMVTGNQLRYTEMPLSRAYNAQLYALRQLGLLD